MAKPKVAFIYEKDAGGLNGRCFTNNGYRFFIKGLPANERIETTLCPIEGETDCRQFAAFDALVINNLDVGKRTKFLHLDEVKAPKVLRGLDAHDIGPDWIGRCREWGIHTIINMCSHKYVRKFLPDDFTYHQFMFGITEEEHVCPPWQGRNKAKLLLTGALPRKFYRLRNDCQSLPYVDYVPQSAGWVNDKYPILLGRYRAAIAACTVDIVYKYAEIPACGCLSFMEVNGENGCEELGYTDGENAVFINQSNYMQKFDQYLKDVHNPRWQLIARAGREYTLGRFENKVEVNRLVDIIEGLI